MRIDGEFNQSIEVNSDGMVTMHLLPQIVIGMLNALGYVAEPDQTVSPVDLMSMAAVFHQIARLTAPKGEEFAKAVEDACALTKPIMLRSAIEDMRQLVKEMDARDSGEAATGIDQIEDFLKSLDTDK